MQSILFSIPFVVTQPRTSHIQEVYILNLFFKLFQKFFESIYRDIQVFGFSDRVCVQAGGPCIGSKFPEYENGRINLLEYLEVAGNFASVSMILDKLGTE